MLREVGCGGVRQLLDRGGCEHDLLAKVGTARVAVVVAVCGHLVGRRRGALVRGRLAAVTLRAARLRPNEPAAFKTHNHNHSTSEKDSTRAPGSGTCWAGTRRNRPARRGSYEKKKIKYARVSTCGGRAAGQAALPRGCSDAAWPTGSSCRRHLRSGSTCFLLK